MTRLSPRTLNDPDLGTITTFVDPDENRIVLEITLPHGKTMQVGWHYEDLAKLAADYAELTDTEILTYAQTAYDEYCGTSGRVLH